MNQAANEQLFFTAQEGILNISDSIFQLNEDIHDWISENEVSESAITLLEHLNTLMEYVADTAGEIANIIPGHTKPMLFVVK